MLTAKEAQAMLGISLRHLYSLAQSGAIAHYRFGKRTLRFEEAQILAYKESCAITVKAPKEISISKVTIPLNDENSELQKFFEEMIKMKKDKSKKIIIPVAP